MNYKKLINDAVAQSNLTEIPQELLSETIHIWKQDINPMKDWDDFIGGQLVNHIYHKESMKAMIDTENIEFGNNTQSFYGLFHMNTTIEAYVSEYQDMTGMIATIGEDTENKFLVVSYPLNNFSLKHDKKEKVYAGKLILVNIVKFLSQELDEGEEAPTLNIEIGKLGETVKIPKKIETKKGEMVDSQIVEYEMVDKKIPKVKYIEILIPKTGAFIGADVISNKDGNPKHDKIVKPSLSSTKPKEFPVNPYYSILPTQFAIPSNDNYGLTHPADNSNAVKVLLATTALSSISSSATSLGGATGKVSSLAGAVMNSATGLAHKFFGDKGTLANSLAITPVIPSSEASTLKFFIQGDATLGDGKEDSNGIDKNGYLKLKTLKDQKDYIEVNQANGEFGKYGKPMSPAHNAGFDKQHIYRALGLESLEMVQDKIPAIATPFANGAYKKLKINDQKINDFLNFGVPRIDIKTKETIGNMIFPHEWEIYIRNMFFRPDPYSFWNWPLLVPAEIGIYQVEKKTSINYDTSIQREGGNPNQSLGKTMLGLVETMGKKAFKEAKNLWLPQESEMTKADGAKNLKSSHWNKTITMEQITENNFYDPNKTFLSLRFEFGKEIENIFQHHIGCFTASIYDIKLLDKDGKLIRRHKMNSQGKNTGTSANAWTVLQY